MAPHGGAVEGPVFHTRLITDDADFLCDVNALTRNFPVAKIGRESRAAAFPGEERRCRERRRTQAATENESRRP
ncbi:hypothetical protein [Allosalinactinospora lopnorensis]|uniref:hypothetical protein n=1 Tax=Allosalinactinospora lopnorensis TaxID=1352348 RepID=UPI000623DEA9|nr:hypothetical protein [Allosalinactinospora lopnorensis]